MHPGWAIKSRATMNMAQRQGAIVRTRRGSIGITASSRRTLKFPRSTTETISAATRRLFVAAHRRCRSTTLGQALGAGDATASSSASLTTLTRAGAFALIHPRAGNRLAASHGANRKGKEKTR